MPIREAMDFATKSAIARSMIERALSANVLFSWVAADSVHGVGDIEMALRRAGKGYVLGVSSKHAFNSWGKVHAVSGTAGSIAENLPPEAWQRLSAGAGTEGERFHDWAYLDLADLDAGEFNADLSGVWTRGLLIRRNIADGDLAFFTTWCPRGATIETLVRVGGHRWAIEDSFETAKSELGLDHNETRSWHGWHRHVSLVMLAFAVMPMPRRPKNDAQDAGSTPALIGWSIQQIRRIANRMAQRQIQAAHIIAWSIWRRAHQPAANLAHMCLKLHL